MKICIECGKQFTGENWECPFCNFTPWKFGQFYLLSQHDKYEGFDPAVFKTLFEIEPLHFWFRCRNKLIIWAIKRYFPNAESFLEIGCGTGFVLADIERAFPKLRLHGSEIFTEGLAYAAQRVSNVELIQMDALNIPFEEEFDLIGAFDVLEHIEDDSKAIGQIFRALRKKGGIIITIPQHMFLWSRFDEASCHYRRYNAREIAGKLERAGFRVLKKTSFISFLFPFLLLSRMTRRKDTDALDELRIKGIFNFIFEKITNVETVAIRVGINFPFGGSLLVIGIKD